MPCLLGCLALAFPRVVFLLVLLFSNYIQSAYATFIWPLLGFLFMPLTALAYAWAKNTYGGLDGVGLAVFVFAVLFDLGLLSGGGWSSRRRRAAA